MELIVCIKQVPDTTEVKFDKQTGTLIREGIETIMNPDDKAALELALSIKDDHEGAVVKVLTMGPPQAVEVLKESLAMGADEGYLLTDVAFAGADTWATSLTLAKAIEQAFNPDIIFCGRQAIDGDTAQVGPQIAEHLGLPQVTYASCLELKENKALVRRHFEHGYAHLEVELPCVITALNEHIKPRYMTPAGIIDVFENLDTKIKHLSSKDVDLPREELGLKGSPTKVRKSVTKGSKAAGELVKENIEEGVAKAIKLIETMNAL